MANSIDVAGSTAFPPAGPRLPVVATFELAVRTFLKAPFTLIGMMLIPVVPLVVIGGLAKVGPEIVRPLLTFVSFLVQYAVQFTLMAALVIVTRNIFDDREREVGDAIQQSFRRLLPLVGMMLLQMIAIGVGMMLFVIPGIIVAVMLFVALPAFVLEGLGPIDSLKRSAALTKGHRWQLFGLSLLILLVLLVFSLVFMGALAQPSKIVFIVVVLLAALAGIVLAGAVVTLPTIVFLQLRRSFEAGSTARF